MTTESPLLVIHGILRPEYRADRLLKLNDLAYSNASGRRRTLPEFQRFFQRAGLQLKRVIRTRIVDLTVLEVIKAG